jgi:hypothetical protein
MEKSDSGAAQGAALESLKAKLVTDEASFSSVSAHSSSVFCLSRIPESGTKEPKGTGFAHQL